MDFEKKVSATIPGFRCMKTVSHRSTPQGTEVVHYFSVVFGALRWLFIPRENCRNERIVQAAALFSFSSSLPIWPFHGGMTSVTLPEAFNWQASRIGESLSPVKPS